jgi:hypothetical protein
MIGLRFAALSLVVPAAGYWLRATSVRRLPMAARVAFYAAGGLLALSAVMFSMSLLGWQWSAGRILVLPLLAGAGAAVLTRRREALEEQPRPKVSLRVEDWCFLALALVAIGVLVLTIASGAATSFDLLFFWGAKGQRFALSHGIDVGFLRDPAHGLMHPDYPPLLPFYYAWTMLGSGQLDWWGAVLSAPALLLLATCAVWGVASGQRHPHAAGLTALFACMFSLLFIQNAVGGNAEPMLVFFETVALVSLTLLESDITVGALALAGCVLTKVEGAVFAVGLVLALAVVRQGRRTARELLLIVTVPALALLTWLGFCRYEGLLDTYRASASVVTATSLLSAATQLAAQASFGLWYLPWLAPILLVAFGNARAARVHGVAVCVYAAFLVYVYGRGGDPTALVDWSATRVLLSPLLIAFAGGIAATGESG